jgi:hypothetical protein
MQGRYNVTYLGTKVGKWTQDDAEKELGQFTDRRDAFDMKSGAVIGDVFKYDSPEPGFATAELNFSRSTKLLTAAYFYYGNPVAWQTSRGRLGKNYKKVKMQNGRPG